MAWVQELIQTRGSRAHVRIKDFTLEIYVWGEPPNNHHCVVLNLSIEEAKDLITDMQRTIAIMEAPKT